MSALPICYSSSRSQSCKSTVTIISAALSMFIRSTPSLTAIEIFFDFVNGEALRQHKIDVLWKNALIGGY